MKKTIFIITGLLILLQWGCRLEELTVECGVTNGFENKYDYGFSGSDAFTARGIVETTDGEYVVCGSIAGDIDDIFLLKVDKNGNQVFFIQDEQAGAENAEAIARTADGGFLVCGRRGLNALFVKYDKDGKREGDATSNISESRCNYLTPTDDGRFMFTSDRRITGSGIRQTHAGIIEIQNNTPNITHEYVPPSAGEPQTAYAAVPSGNGNFVVVGESSKSTGNADLYIFKLDENLELIPGSEVFTPLSPSSLDRGRSVVKSYKQNEYIISGWNGGTAFAFRYNDNNQSVTTMTEYTGGGQVDGFGIVQAHTEDQYVVVGDQWQGDQNTAPRQVFLTKIGENGNQIWEKRFGEDNLRERGFRIIRTADCGYAIVGFETQTSTALGFKAYVIKVDEDGNI